MKYKTGFGFINLNEFVSQCRKNNTNLKIGCSKSFHFHSTTDKGSTPERCQDSKNEAKSEKYCLHLV